MMIKGEKILRKQKKKITNKLCLHRSKELDLQLASSSRILR